MASFDEVVKETVRLGDEYGAEAALKYSKQNNYDLAALEPAINYYRKTGEVIGYGAFDAFVQGASLGSSDEIGALFSGAYDTVFRDGDFFDNYYNRLGEYRTQMKAYNKANPGTALAMEMLGGAATGLVTLGAGAKAGIGTAAMRAAPIRTSMAVGAGEGGITGVMSGEGTGGRLLGGALGAVGGGLIGGAVPAVASAGRRLLTSADDRALGDIAQAAVDEGVSPATARATIEANQARDAALGLEPQEMLSDVFTPSGAVQSLQRGASNAGDLGGDVRNIMAARQQGVDDFDVTGMPSQPGQVDRVSRELNIKGGMVEEDAILVDGLHHRGRNQFSADYEKAFADNQYIMNETVFRGLNAPFMRDGYRIAREKYAGRYWKNDQRWHEENMVPVNPADLFDANGVMRGPVPLEFLDLAKREAQKLAYARKGGLVTPTERLDDKGVAEVRQRIGEWKEELLKNVEGDTYKNLLETTSDIFAVNEAFDLGRQFFRGAKGKADLAGRISKMTDVEKDAVRMGALQEIKATLNNKKTNQNVIQDLIGSKNMKERIAILFEGDDDAYDKFVNRMQREVRMLVNRQFQTSQSSTARQQIEAELFDTMRQIGIAMASPSYAVGQAAERAGKSRSQAQANATNRMLMEQNPDAQIATLNRLDDAMKAQRMFNMGAMAGVPIAGGVTSLLGSE